MDFGEVNMYNECTQNMIIYMIKWKGMKDMATRTILTNVNIKGKKDVRQFVQALERAENLKSSHDVVMSRIVRMPKGDELDVVLQQIKK